MHRFCRFALAAALLPGAAAWGTSEAFTGGWCALSLDAGDPVEAAKAYDLAGADELCFLDITASHENRSIILDVVSHTPVETAALEELRQEAGWTDAMRHLRPQPEKIYSWWSNRSPDWRAAASNPPDFT